MNYEIVNLGIVVLSGFTQKASGRTGMGELYCELRRRYATTPKRYIIHRAWDADMDELAHLLDRDRTRDFRLAVTAYSWGCGRGVRRLAKSLGQRGIAIDLLLLIDPVIYRPGFWFSPRQLWALTRLGKFKVPPNVDEVYSWRQVNKGPFGRRLKLENRRTTVLGGSVMGSHEKLLKYGHSGQGQRDCITDPNIGHDGMDDDPRIRQMVLDRLDSFVKDRLAG